MAPYVSEDPIVRVYKVACIVNFLATRFGKRACVDQDVYSGMHVATSSNEAIKLARRIILKNAGDTDKEFDGITLDKVKCREFFQKTLSDLAEQARPGPKLKSLK